MFKLFKTKSRSNNLAPHYILSPKSDHQESASLWFNRTSGEIYIKKFCQTGDFELAAEQPIFGFVGKFQVNQNHSPKLIFIKRADIVGKLKVKNEEHKIFRIREILVLNSTPPNSFSHDEIECEVLMNDQDLKPSASFTTISSVLNGSPSSLSASTSSEAIAKNATNISTRFEKKILIEIYKIFQENSGSFYFSYTYDLTNSVERQQEQFERGAKKGSLDWRLADERFFWNKYLLMDVLEINSNEEFVTPVIQGFVQLEQHIINSSKELGPIKEIKAPDPLRLALISRRSRYRLGTRLKRRGIDDQGNVANFVETEQIINVYGEHTLSFVQIRGSIPVYWSQPGIKYRPAPRIDKTQTENKAAFKIHFDQLQSNYKNFDKFLLINLVEETGKESILGDAYVEQLAELNNQKIVYIQFDFHEHCKGLKFENVSILKDKVKEILVEPFCWIDDRGFIFKQKTLLRVNCVDCLDRTNVVQMVMAKYVLENQLQPLGILVPPSELAQDFKRKIWFMWANNGDAISEQYAGTSALKGDYTRTGERKFAGILRDGMNSANRYYLRFRDAFRQMALDVLQGVPAFENEQISKSNLLSPAKNEENSEDQSQTDSEREENIRQLLNDCKKELVSQNEDCYGIWALINFNESNDDISQVDPDVFLILTNSAIYVSNYDDAVESFLDYEKIELENVEKIELGPEPVSDLAFFKSTPRFYVLRIYYKDKHEPSTEPLSLFYSFRSSNLRFFNNLVLTTKSQDEMIESLRGICQTIQSTLIFFGNQIQFDDVNKLNKKKSKPHTSTVQLRKLSTRISMEGSKSPNGPSDSKILRFGKIIGSKLFRKNNTQSPNLNQTIETSDNLVELNETTSDLIQLEDSSQTSQIEECNQELLIDISDLSVNEEKGKAVSSMKREKSSNSLNSMGNVPSTPRSASRNYIPKLSQKQFANRLAKISDTKEIIKESKTNFIFI